MLGLLANITILKYFLLHLSAVRVEGGAATTLQQNVSFSQRLYCNMDGKHNLRRNSDFHKGFFVYKHLSYMDFRFLYFTWQVRGRKSRITSLVVWSVIVMSKALGRRMF